MVDEGWEYEPGQRHAETIAWDMNLKEAKFVKTPREEEKELLR